MADFKINITGDASGVVAAAGQAQGALEKTEKATDQVTGSKKKLGEALKTLGNEFPILGSLGRAAMNPIVGAATLAVIGFRKLAEDIKQLGTAFESAEWDTYTGAFQKQKQALLEAAVGAREFARELSKIRSEAITATEESDKLMQVYKARESAQDRLDSAAKRLELAQAAGEKDPVKRAQREYEIEDRYAQRKLKRTEEASKFEIQEQHRKLANEHIQGEAIDRQLAQARERQASLKSEAFIAERLRVEEQRLGAIRSDYTKKRDRVEELDAKSLLFRSMPQEAELAALKGQLPALEHLLRNQESAVAGLRRRQPGDISASKSAAADIADLEAQRKANLGRQTSIYDQLPTQERIAEINQRAGRGEAAMDSATRARTALNQGQAQQAQANQEIAQGIEHQVKGMEGVIRLFIAGSKRVESLTETVRQLEGQVAKLR